MPTYLVTEGDDGGEGWTVRRDGVEIDSARYHYGPYEAMQLAEQDAGQPLTWRLTPDGFESVGPNSDR